MRISFTGLFKGRFLVLLSNGGVAGVIFGGASLAVLAPETEDDQQAEGDEEHQKHENARPVRFVIEAILLKDLVGVIFHVLSLARDRELRHHHGGETVAHRREIHQPGDIPLR